MTVVKLDGQNQGNLVVKNKELQFRQKEYQIGMHNNLFLNTFQQAASWLEIRNITRNEFEIEVGKNKR